MSGIREDPPPPRRGGRARALACLLVGLLGLSLARLSLRQGPTACVDPVSAGDDEPARVACHGQPAGGARQLPLGAQRVFSLPVDLNTLTAADLESLDGIGPKLAQRIVDERRRRRGFGSVEELGEVKGIGPTRLAALRAIVHPKKP